MALTVATAVGVGGLAGAPSAGASGAPIKIGVIFPLSGALAQAGIDNLNGVKIAVKQINASGGIHGRKVVLIPKDSTTPATAASNATQLINADHVQEIIGSVISTLALAAAPVANRNKVIYWEVEAVANNLTSQGFKYLFRVPCDSNTLGSEAAQYAVKTVATKLKIPVSSLKVAVISVTGAYGVDTTHGVISELHKLGVKPVDNLSYTPTSTTLDPLILKLKTAAPDIIIATSYSPTSILFMKEAKQLGLHYKALVGTGAGQTPITFELGIGATANGILSSSFAYNVSNSALSRSARSQNAGFKKAYKKAFHQTTNIGAYLAYVGTRDLLTVMQKAGGPSPKAVRTAALKIKLPLGSSVNGWGLKFTKTGQNVLSPATMTEWQNKVLKVISPPRFADAKLQVSSLAH